MRNFHRVVLHLYEGIRAYPYMGVIRSVASNSRSLGAGQATRLPEMASFSRFMGCLFQFFPWPAACNPPFSTRRMLFAFGPMPRFHSGRAGLNWLFARQEGMRNITAPNGQELVRRGCSQVNQRTYASKCSGWVQSPRRTAQPCSHPPDVGKLVWLPTGPN